MSRKFWNWDPGGEERTMYLDGDITDGVWEDGVTPELFRSELFAGDGPVTIWINSRGGDCIAASRMYAMLMEYPHDVTVKIDGIAASAASVVAMAGTTVLMAPTALMLIHNPATVAVGNKAEMKKAIEMLDEVKESIINAYEIKTGLPRDKISRLMDGEALMPAQTAIGLGFADGMLKGTTNRDDGATLLNRIIANINNTTNTANNTTNTTATTDAKADEKVGEKEEKRGRAVAELLERLRRIAGEKGELK